MFKPKFYLFIALTFCFLSQKHVSANNTLSELNRLHEYYISRRGFGARQELDDELCQMQNNLTSKALTFTDATGKIPTGILIGNLNNFGQYDQCLSIDETVEGVNIKGKYCMMQVTLSVTEMTADPSLAMPGMSMSGLFGVCVANACEATFIDQHFNCMNISSEELYCREAGDKPIAAHDVVAIVIFSIVGLLLVLSTGYHLAHKLLLNKDVSKIAKSFSVYHNVTRLTNIPKSKNPLDCINGIRTLSIIWVVLGHSHTIYVRATLENMMDFFAWITSVSATRITAATLAVDTFFYLAAFLLTWSVLNKFNRPIAFVKAVPLLYVNRYLRLTPTMAAVMLLQVSFFNHISDGPDWRIVSSAKTNCLNNWWVNLIYLQNYLRPSETCLSHTWYLAIDMQLYLAAPFLLFFLFLTIKFAILSLTIVSLASLGAALGYCLYYNFDILFGLGGNSFDISFADRYYRNTIPRSSPFVLGIVVAYVVFTLKKNNVTIIKKPLIAFHWIVTGILLAMPLYGTYTTISEEPSQTAINFFNAWHRPAWALGVGGIIVASIHGFGGPIGWFLSLDMWRIPARLSYVMYLIHYPIMFSVVGSQTSPGRYSESILVYRFLSDLALTISAAFLLNVIIEAPFAELSNILFNKISGTTKNNRASKNADGISPSVEHSKENYGKSSIVVEGVTQKGVRSSVEYNQFTNDDAVLTTSVKGEDRGRI